MDAADPDCCQRARRCAPNGRSARVAPTSTKSRKPRLVSEPHAWLPLWTSSDSAPKHDDRKRGASASRHEQQSGDQFAPAMLRANSIDVDARLTPLDPPGKP